MDNQEFFNSFLSYKGRIRHTVLESCLASKVQLGALNPFLMKLGWTKGRIFRTNFQFWTAPDSLDLFSAEIVLPNIISEDYNQLTADAIDTISEIHNLSNIHILLAALGFDVNWWAINKG